MVTRVQLRRVEERLLACRRSASIIMPTKREILRVIPRVDVVELD